MAYSWSWKCLESSIQLGCKILPDEILRRTAMQTALNLFFSVMGFVKFAPSNLVNKIYEWCKGDLREYYNGQSVPIIRKY